MLRIYLFAMGCILSIIGGFIAFGFQALFKILLVITILYCGVSFFFVPLLWGGLFRVGILGIAVKLFKSYELF